MVQYGKLIAGIIAAIIGFLLVNETHIIPILLGSSEGAVYSLGYMFDGSSDLMFILGLAGLAAIAAGIILLLSSLSSRNTFYDSDEYEDDAPRHRPQRRDAAYDAEPDLDGEKAFCPYCGAKVTRETQFCTSCGKRLR